MKATTWLALGATTLAATLYLTRNDAPAAPDQTLAAHVAHLCSIARKNVDTPEPGIRAFGRYMGAHAESLLGSWGATLSTIERIPDDAAHDDRARLARDRIRKPLDACAHDFERFFTAVENDEDAREVLERALERLNRTLEIIAGGSVTGRPDASTWRARLRDLTLLVR